MKLIILILAHNEENSIVDVIKGIPQRIPAISEKEIVVIDDGSKDKTAEIARRTGALVFSNNENMGVGVSFQRGIDVALKRAADIVVAIDADMQFDPKDIPKLINVLFSDKADLVTASRFINKSFIPQNMSKVKILGNRILAKFISLLIGKKFYDVTCGFRAYSKEALLRINLFGVFTYTQEVILSLKFKGLKIIEIPIKVRYFPERKSLVSDNLIRYVYYVFKIIFRTIFDYKPLKFFGGSGIFIFLIGLVLDVIMMIIFFQSGQFSPYKFIGVIGVILNIFGLMLFIIGLIADMLNRIRQNQERILYFQKKKIYYGK